MKKSYLTSYLFVLPMVLLFLTFIVYPITYNIIISFYDWNGISIEKVFTGFSNYCAIFQDKVFWTAAKNFCIFTLVFTVIQCFLGLVFASFLVRKIRFSGFYRFMYYLPSIISATIVGSVFSKILEFNKGDLNMILKAIGLDMLCQPWLSTKVLAIVCVCFVIVWKGMGYNMLIYYSNMLNIPDELYEAATLDGASNFQQFWWVTFPLLRGTHFTLLVLNVLASLKLFDLPYVLTAGGPGNATKTFSLYIYTKSFETFQQGQASATAVVMLGIAMILTVIQLKMYYWGDKDKELAG